MCAIQLNLEDSNICNVSLTADLVRVKSGLSVLQLIFGNSGMHIGIVKADEGRLCHGHRVFYC